MNNKKALIAAASKGSIKSVPKLIESLASVHPEGGDSPFNDALCAAAEKGHPEIVELLLDAGADVHARKDTALRMAVENGHTETVKLLINRGANIKAEGDNWRTHEVLVPACSGGHEEIAALLLDGGANVNAFDFDGPCAPLRKAVANGHCKVIDLLIDCGAVIEQNILGKAVDSGQLESAALLLDRGSFGQTERDHALRLAAQLGLTAIISLLIDHGADIHADGDKVLAIAAFYQRVESVALLVDRGGHRENNPNLALIAFASTGNSEETRELIKRGADLRSWQDAALKRAIRYKHPEIVKILATRYDIPDLRAVRDAMDRPEEKKSVGELIADKKAREALRDPGIDI